MPVRVSNAPPLLSIAETCYRLDVLNLPELGQFAAFNDFRYFFQVAVESATCQHASRTVEDQSELWQLLLKIFPLDWNRFFSNEIDVCLC